MQNLNLKEIKAMFEPGTRWSVMNTFQPQANGRRRVERRMLTEIKWRCADGQVTFSYFPKAEQIIDARDGYLHYRMFTEGDYQRDSRKTLEHTLTFTRLA